MHRCSVACSIAAPIDDAVAVAKGTRPMLLLLFLSCDVSPPALPLLLLLLLPDRLPPTIAANVAIAVWSENVRNCAGTPSLQMLINVDEIVVPISCVAACVFPSSSTSCSLRCCLL